MKGVNRAWLYNKTNFKYFNIFIFHLYNYHDKVVFMYVWFSCLQMYFPSKNTVYDFIHNYKITPYFKAGICSTYH